MKVTFDRHLSGYDKKAAVDIIFHPTTTDEIERLFKAEDELHNLGLGFDTGFDIDAKERIWQLDWSLNNETDTAERDVSRRLEREQIGKHAALGNKKGRERPR